MEGSGSRDTRNTPGANSTTTTPVGLSHGEAWWSSFNVSLLVNLLIEGGFFIEEAQPYSESSSESITLEGSTDSFSTMPTEVKSLSVESSSNEDEPVYMNLDDPIEANSRFTSEYPIATIVDVVSDVESSPLDRADGPVKWPFGTANVVSRLTEFFHPSIATTAIAAATAITSSHRRHHDHRG
ncbi:hypothetical protein IFM89_016475 [Coptis chinensis]|uniref:Uncharacterized protein n=1 Tax=Coptis chinensis TaxID=261450 RepID=A0A835M3L0_9MAGN|nr:hypothetical protein IFM89_016475 [Coptis chinensis]